MGILSNFIQLILAVVLVINAFLAFLVYRSNRKSATNIIFVILSLIISIWLVIIHNASIPYSPSITLAYTRFAVFFAVSLSVSFFLLAHTFPDTNLLLKKRNFYLLLGATLFMMGFTLTPYVFKEVQIQGENIKSIPGIGIAFFAVFTSFFSLSAIYVLIKKIKNSVGEVKQQLLLMMKGILLMLGLIITTIMIPVMFFQNQMFIPFSPLYALIFLGMTAYAVVKHHLFKLKIIATEALTSLLWIILFSKIFVSPTPAQRVVDIIIFVATIIFGILLIKSVRKEVQQREQLEILDKELQEANVKLKALDQARAEFITIASHQLRTPPATIKWYLSSVISGDYGQLAPEQKDILEKTNRTNNSLISLIDDMLNVSRIERGKMEFLFEQASLLDLAKITFEQLEPIAKEKKLVMTFKFSPKTKFPKLMADKEKIRQVMNNLIDNALKYTKQGTVAVELSVIGGDIKFSVTDSGKGIPPEDQTSIFEKYTRGKESIKQSAGLGLGLYVAKIIVGQHKGKIWAESPGDGKGSTFAFTVPINNDLKETTLVDLAKNQG